MAEREWTPAQKNAIEAKSGTVLVSAAAGSGKTSVLVERIVRKLTDPHNGVSPDSLLVVTFTNAAAAEMRARIFRQVSLKINEEPDRRSEYMYLLANLSEMQVCTMDSFCMNLVKANSHLVDIDSDFRILDNSEEEKLKRKTAAQICEKRFNENYDTFLPLTDMFDAGKNDAAFMNTIISLSDYSVSEPDPALWLQGVADYFTGCAPEHSVWGKCITSDVVFALKYCIELSDGAFADIGEDEELELKLTEMFNYDRMQLEEALSKAESGTWNEKYDGLTQAYCNIRAKKFARLPSVYTNNPSKLAAQAKRNEYKEVLEKAIRKICCTEEENAEDVRVLASVADELIVTVKEYNEKLLCNKKEMSAFSFSDISHFALSLLYDASSGDGKTQLARELTESFSEILIDEYQDTNRAQDTLFRTISKNGKNMFLVGDVKQSIYRFRLASPEIFIEKCDRFPYYDGKADESKIILSENFRSRKGILDGVNFIFSSLMSKEVGEIEYNSDERLNFPGKTTDEEAAAPVVSYTLAETLGEDEEAVEARYIVQVIKEKLRNGHVGKGDEQRPAVPSDFCILLRSKNGTLPHFVRTLREAGIPVSSESADRFFETAEIKTVMSYLRVIDNPMKDTDLLAVLMSPFFGFSADDAASLRIRYGRKGYLYTAVCKAADDGDVKCSAFVKKLRYFKKLSSCLPVDVLIREIYADSAFLYMVSSMPDGKAGTDNLNRLLEMAEEGSEYRSSLGSFIRFADTVREMSKDTGNTSDSDGVRIMSMHKSKGLEFPFVFIAGTSKQFNKSDIRSSLVVSHNYGVGIKRREKENIKLYDTLSSIAVKTDSENNSMSEELRILYVAVTRAKQELHIVSAVNKALEKLEKTEYLLSNMKGVPSYAVRHATAPCEWLMMCFLRHPDGKKIRTVMIGSSKAEGHVAVEYVSGVPATEVMQAEKVQVLPDEKIVAEIRERAEYAYEWSSVASSLSKHTASSLTQEHFDPAGFGKSVPGFMFSGKMSPSDIGTATHRFLQFCDFCDCKNDVAEEIERLVANGRLSRKQADAVDVMSIKVFVESDIMKRIEGCEAVYREKQFTMAKSICELDGSIPDCFRDEKTVVIGKIDLLFIEDDGAVIVDYKTDNINDVSILKKRYRQQMDIYAEAISKSMGIKVKECILYSLKLKESISLKV